MHMVNQRHKDPGKQAVHLNIWTRYRPGGRDTGASIKVKVPGNMPPVIAYFFGLLVQPGVCYLTILVDFSLGKGIL